MQVIKRDRMCPYDKNKIRNAIIQAYNQISYPNFKEIDNLVDEIDELVDVSANEDGTIGVETIENLIMSVLYREVPLVAREFSSYKIHKEKIKENPSEIDKVLYVSPEIDTENANKKAVLTHIKNAYLAEIPSREEMRKAFPPSCIEAHDRGVVYAHDMGYSIRDMHNCLARETKFVTSDGVKSFYDFDDGDEVFVLSADGDYHKAIVHYYGKEKLFKYTFYNGKKTNIKTVLATENHRWYLNNGSITTNLSVGDKLLRAPHIFDFEISEEDFNSASEDCRIMWCKGFAIGDGTVRYNAEGKDNNTRIRLCGEKNKYLSRFNIPNHCKILSQIYENGDHSVLVQNYRKEIPVFLTLDEIKYFFSGLYSADGRQGVSTKCIQISNPQIIDFVRTWAPAIGCYITVEKDLTGQVTNYGKRPYTIMFHFINQPHFYYTVLKKEFEREDEVWCLEVEDTHNFILPNGIVTGNCELLDLDYLLQHGCEINNTWVNKPHSFRVACTVATQILTHVTSNTYGGCTINLLALAKFVDISRKAIHKKYSKYADKIDEATLNQMKEEELYDEIRQGIQTFTYQNQTLCADVGQAVFLTISVYLNEDPQYTDDLIIVFKELLKQRIAGVPNKEGIAENPNFPKILYFLDEDTMKGGKYYDVTRLCAECSAKRLVPDYMSVKKHMELKGVVTPSMGCRALLSPYRDENGKLVTWGRFNCGVMSLNLPYIAMENNKTHSEEQLFKNLDHYLSIANQGMIWRVNHIAKIKAKVCPILWQYGGLARLNPEDTLEKLVYGGYATVTLGYSGLHEAVYYITGENHWEGKGKELAHKILDYLNKNNKDLGDALNVSVALYSTPAETLTDKFAKACVRDFGTVDGEHVRNFETNGYHIPVFHKIDAFSKLSIEAQFSDKTLGGSISYVEVPNMSNNIDAMLEIIEHIGNNCLYAEVNSEISTCGVCGFEGYDFKKVYADDGTIRWKCPSCGETDPSKVRTSYRICGYISNYTPNQGRSEDIMNRVKHLN